MKCDSIALKKNAALCTTLLGQLSQGLPKDLLPQSATVVRSMIEEMLFAVSQLSHVTSEYEKAMKKADCYVQSIRPE